MLKKWRVTLYLGLKGMSDHPKIFDEVHVTNEEELTIEQIVENAMIRIGAYPKTHYTEVTRIK